MTFSRTAPAAGIIDPQSLPRGPTGTPCCRRCGREVAAPQRAFCSDACQHEHLIRTNPAYARRCVAERDQGICQQCGRDTNSLPGIYEAAKRHYDDLFPSLGTLRGWGSDWFERRVFSHFFHADLAALVGVTRRGVAWEMDHEIPVVEGGGECGLENLRTLCIPCHRHATRDLKGRLRRAARAQSKLNQPDFFSVSP